MVGPDYTRPSVEVPADWRLPAGTMSELVNGAWWQQFGDPVLDRLIETALANNRDLKIAAARVEQFLGQYTATHGEQFPLLDAAGTFGRERLPASQRLPGQAATVGVDQLAAGVSFELDLRGKLRRATEAARAELLESEAARQTVVLTLVGSVASHRSA
jgi:multidrug efflux system outer membrane protein